MSGAPCSSIDCGRVPPDAQTPPAPWPAIDLLAHDYDSLLRALLDLLPARAPGWADRNPADPGMALLELFAYAGDQLAYQQDRIALEGFLRTATQYESVRKLLRLVDYSLYPGHSAHAELVVEATGNAPLHLPAGFAFSTRARADEAAVVFETASAAFLYPGLSRIALAADAPANLAGDSVVLASIDTAMLLPGWRLLIESASSREWVELASISIGATTTTLSLTAPLHNAYPVVSSRLHGNLVTASHGQRVQAQQIAGGGASEVVALEYAPLTYVKDASGIARSSLEVSVEGVSYSEVEDFVDSLAADTHYRLQHDNLGYCSVEFGDGLRGRRPPAGARIDLSYRFGLGAAGRVAAETLSQFEAMAFPDASQHLLAARNPFASGDAADPETIEHARLVGPHQLGKITRAVVEADFDTLALEGVVLGEQRWQPLNARTRFRHNGAWTTAVVSLDMPDRRPLSAQPGLRDALGARLAACAMAGTDVKLEDPRYVPLSIGLRLEVAPALFARDVRQAVERALFAPGDANAFFAPGRHGFGAAIHLSDLYAVVCAVPGVRAVSVTRFKRLGDRYPDRESAGFIDISPLEIARCDNDPAHSESGVLRIRTVGSREG